MGSVQETGGRGLAFEHHLSVMGRKGSTGLVGIGKGVGAMRGGWEASKGVKEVRRGCRQPGKQKHPLPTTIHSQAPPHKLPW